MMNAPKRFVVLTADLCAYEDEANDVPSLFNRFRKLQDVSPLDCQFLILPQKRVYMVYWPAPATGPLDQKRPLNFAATRILVDLFLLDTPMPAQSPVDPQQEIQRAMRCCAFGKVVFLKVDDKENLLDYSWEELRADWAWFFRTGHPCCECKFNADIERVPYSRLGSKKSREPLVQQVLREDILHDTVSQRQRVETLLIGHNLYKLKPELWLNLNQFDAVIHAYPLIKK